MTSRETVMAALTTLMTGVSGFGSTNVSRRNRAPESIGPANSPFLFVLESGEEYVRDSVSMPPKRHLMVNIVLYNDVGPNPNAVPTTVINNALDALDAALTPTNPANILTLGGLVDSVVLDGEVKKAPGDKTGKALAIVPLRIVLP